MARRKTTKTPVESGSGNLFVDLGFADAGEMTTKVALAVEINRVMHGRGLTQAGAAQVLEVSQPKVSALKNYRLDGFSVGHLLNLLTALGRDVRISIGPKRSGRATGRVSVAAG
jgi:predicted XRE-type DNA-binding protein